MDTLDFFTAQILESYVTIVDEFGQGLVENRKTMIHYSFDGDVSKDLVIKPRQKWRVLVRQGRVVKFCALLN